jgi:molybdopterin-guanine dinucleotide biosynthesis protein A
MEKTEVLILAGGTLPEDLKQYSSGHDNRALLKIGGKYMIEYVIDALNGVEELGGIHVIGPKEELEKALGDRVAEVIEAKDSMLDNLSLGVARFEGAQRLLISTCDIPLVKMDMIARFLETCKATTADLYYPIVEKKLNDKQYPTTKRTYAKLKEGVFTGGNIVLLNPDMFRKNWSYIERALAARKSPIKLLSIIGIGFIIRFVLKQLALQQLEKKVEGILGIKVKAVEVLDPEIGIDVDKESDFLLCRGIIEGKK